MAKTKFTFLKWYTKVLKSGKVRRFARHATGKKGGQYARWEDAETLDRPEGEFRIKEWVIHFRPTNRGNVPSGNRDFEVRIQLPEGDATEDDIEEIARDIMRNLTNDAMVDESQVDWDKKGVDTISYSDDDDIKWMMVDTARPQFKYPKGKQLGIYGEDYRDEE